MPSSSAWWNPLLDAAMDEALMAPGLGNTKSAYVFYHVDLDARGASVSEKNLQFRWFQGSGGGFLRQALPRSGSPC
jgi:hypothetical protein